MMNAASATLTEKIQTLTEQQLAQVEEFVDSLRHSSDSVLLATASEPSFEAVWNNPEDDVYDVA